jgi:hypothetical protein
MNHIKGISFLISPCKIQDKIPLFLIMIDMADKKVNNTRIKPVNNNILFFDLDIPQYIGLFSPAFTKFK